MGLYSEYLGKIKAKIRQWLIFQNFCKIASHQNFIAPLWTLKGFVTSLRLQNKSKSKLGTPSGVSVLDLVCLKRIIRIFNPKDLSC